MANDSISFQVNGFREFAKALETWPKTNIKTAQRKSLNRAATPLLKAAKANGKRLNHRNAKLGSGFLRIPGSDSYIRELTRNSKKIRTIYKPLGSTFIKKTRTVRKSGTILTLVGPESTTAPHANLIEFGTAPHVIRLKNGATIKHPGSRPQPLIRDAFLRSKGQIESTLRDQLEKNLKIEADKIARKTQAAK
jgi:HK97 gp10 family phage protein